TPGETSIIFPTSLTLYTEKSSRARIDFPADGIAVARRRYRKPAVPATAVRVWSVVNVASTTHGPASVVAGSFAKCSRTIVPFSKLKASTWKRTFTLTYRVGFSAVRYLGTVASPIL